MKKTSKRILGIALAALLIAVALVGAGAAEVTYSWNGNTVTYTGSGSDELTSTIVNDSLNAHSGNFSAVIGTGITTIGSGAFGGKNTESQLYDDNLTSVTIGEGVTSIGSTAFQGDTGLTSVHIPNSVTTIYSSAFNICSNLSSVTIGGQSKLGYIVGSAFQSCASSLVVTLPTYAEEGYTKSWEDIIEGTSATQIDSSNWGHTFSASEEPLHTHDGVTFETPIDTAEKLTTLCTNGGSGYLTADITGNFTVKADKTVNLCLNGHVIYGNYYITVIEVGYSQGKYGTFNLYDCGTKDHYFKVSDGTTPIGGKTYPAGLWVWDSSKESCTGEQEGYQRVTGGCITGGYGGCLDGEGGITDDNGGGVRNNGIFTMYSGNLVGNMTIRSGGGVYDGSGSTFTMNGGTIKGNVAEGGGSNLNQGGGVMCYGTFTMNGGIINDNYAENDGGGVEVMSLNVTIGGSAVVKDNKSGSEYVADNLYLSGPMKISLGTLSSGASIGVTRSSGAGAFTTNGTAGDVAYFHSDKTNFNVQFDNGQLKLVAGDPEYTVTYNGNGNTSGTAPTDTNKYKTNDEVTVLGNTGSLVKTDYTFSGWNTQADGTGTDYAAGAKFNMGSANVTLYAKWTEKDKYTVTYSGNGSTSGTAPTDSNKYETNDDVTVLDNTGSLVKTDYTFSGWNTRADGTGTSYAAGDTFKMGSANVTLYAKWTPITFTVTFYGNGGTGSMSPQEFKLGVSQKLSKNTYDKDGYVVGGWAIEEDGKPIYADEQEITVAKNTNLYAYWIEDSGTTKEVPESGKVVVNEDSEKDGNISTVTFETVPEGNVVLVIKEDSEKKTEIPNPDGLIVRYPFDINVYKDGSLYTDPVTAVVKFTVDKSAVSSTSGVKLAHWKDTEWVYIDATCISEDDDNYTFEATVDSFSPFAIVGPNPSHSGSSVTSFFGEKNGNDFTFDNAVVITKATLPGASSATVTNTSGAGWYNCNLTTDSITGNGILYFQVPLDVLKVKGYTINDVSLVGSKTTYLKSENGYAKYSAVITKGGALTIDFEEDAATSAVEKVQEVVEQKQTATEQKQAAAEKVQETVEQKQTTTQTAAKSPFPVLGILAGLGIAGFVALRRR